MTMELLDERIAAGDTAAARAQAQALYAREPTARMRMQLQRRLDRLEPLRRCRVWALASFTVEPIAQVLRFHAALNGLALELCAGPFNQFEPLVLDPAASLYSDDPDLVVVAIEAEHALPGACARFSSTTADGRAAESQAFLDRMDDLCAALRQHGSAPVVVHNLASPAAPLLGQVDAQLAMGQALELQACNAQLQALVAARPGCHLLDLAGLVARHGQRTLFDERNRRWARMPFSNAGLERLAQAWLALLLPLLGLGRKCVVLDCDNTLWGGVVGEDGLGGIAIGHDFPGNCFRAFQERLLALHDRGVLLALASKNNEADVQEVLDHHPEMLLRREHIAAMAIDWTPKPDTIAGLAERLNIGVDSLVFFDDNPVEREAVRSLLPQVLVPELAADPSTYVTSLEDCYQLEGLTWSKEDAGRTAMYRAQAERAELKERSTDLATYLASLGSRARVSVDDPSQVPRVAQLCQRTNQFNCTTIRHDEGAVHDFCDHPQRHQFTLRLRDRFGDNGIVGAALTIMKGDTAEIDTFLISCRALGRQVERWFLAAIVERLTADGAVAVLGRHIPSAKNSQTADFYEQSGFERLDESEGERRFVYRPADGPLSSPAWIANDDPEESNDG